MIVVIVREEIEAHPRDPPKVEGVHRKARLRQQLVEGTFPFHILPTSPSSLFLLPDLLILRHFLSLRFCGSDPFLEDRLPLEYGLGVGLAHHQDAHLAARRGGGEVLIAAARGSTSVRRAGSTVPIADGLLAGVEVGGYFSLLARRLAVHIVSCHLEL